MGALAVYLKNGRIRSPCLGPTEIYMLETQCSSNQERHYVLSAEVIGNKPLDRCL